VIPILRTGAALLLVFVVVTAIADVAGAKNLGTAMTFGQIGFALALVGVMLRGTRAVVREASNRSPE
jgi:hypothetical protein